MDTGERQTERRKPGGVFINCEAAGSPVGLCQVQLLQFFFLPLASHLLDSKSIATEAFYPHGTGFLWRWQ